MARVRRTHGARLTWGVAICLVAVAVSTSTASAEPRKVVAAMDGGFRADYHPRMGCVLFYDVTDMDNDPCYVMKDNLMFSVWLGYEITTTANKEELEALAVNPVNGTTYVLCYDSYIGGQYDSQADDGTGDWDLWRIDYQTILKDFVDNSRPAKTMYIPSTGADGFDYEGNSVTHPGGVYNTVYMSSGIEKIGELARNGDMTAGSQNTGGGDYFEVDMDFVDPERLLVMDDSDYPDGYYGDPVSDAAADHRIVAIKRVDPNSGQATHDANQTAAREGGYNNGTSQSWETFDLGLINMDGFTNDPNLPGYDANYPIGYVATYHSEPIDMQYVTRSREGAVWPDPPGGTTTIQGVWLGENDTPSSTSDDVDFNKITGWDGGADDMAYRGGFRVDNIADPNDNNGDLDWIKVDENGNIVYGESGYWEGATGHEGEEGWGSHEPKVFTRSILDYEYTQGGNTFYWADPCDLTMYGPIPDGNPDDDTDVCDGRFLVLDAGENQVYYLDVDGSPDFKPDVYAYDTDTSAFVHQETDSLGLTDGGKMTASLGKEMYDLTGDNDLTQADMTEMANILGTSLYDLTVTINNVNYGSVEVDPNCVQCAGGTEVTLTAIPVDGKSLNFWRIWDPNHPGDANYAVDDSNNPLLIQMMSDMEIEARFKCGTSAADVLFPSFLGLMLISYMVRRHRRTQ